MDARVQSFLDKLRTMADKTSQAASNAADAAGKKAGELAGATRLNLQIFDLNSECEALYKEIGKLVYDLHRGAETPEEAIDEKIAALDARQEKLAALRAELATVRTAITCPHCGRTCSGADTFCAGCGGKL